MRELFCRPAARPPQAVSFCRQGARESQQDTSGISVSREKGLLAVVADGMGGLKNGGELSALAVSALLRHFDETPAMADPVLELCDLCAQAARAVDRQLSPQGRGTGGTTLAAAILREGQLAFLSVGDSRIGLVRGGGLLWLNRPHSYSVQLLGMAIRGEVTLAQALRDPQRRSLTSYLGSDGPLEVDFSPEPLPLMAGDRVLLMTDGVSGVLSGEEIAAAVRGTAQQAAQRLEQAVLDKADPAQDNFTAVVAVCG